MSFVLLGSWLYNASQKSAKIITSFDSKTSYIHFASPLYWRHFICIAENLSLFLFCRQTFFLLQLLNLWHTTLIKISTLLIQLPTTFFSSLSFSYVVNKNKLQYFALSQWDRSEEFPRLRGKWLEGQWRLQYTSLAYWNSSHLVYFESEYQKLKESTSLLKLALSRREWLNPAWAKLIEDAHHYRIRCGADRWKTYALPHTRWLGRLRRVLQCNRVLWGRGGAGLLKSCHYYFVTHNTLTAASRQQVRISTFTQLCIYWIFATATI